MSNDLKAVRPPPQNVNARRVDVATPLNDTLAIGALPSVPEPPAKAPRPVIVLSTTVAYRGRVITIANEGMTLDQFCDMLDKRFGVIE